ncbi:hypothetical protein C6P41_000972 [Kluyveromyces marxianus]|uniref:Sorbose reductase homolog SOU2 n=2 Tax=Kluyveromyces marxianus TaxID=4911 RepID=W0T431_KLUMD|nr:uncharacterized protein KLMA_10715 [Kluyveromyces marxianus DMKU3-1042]KAG0679171.1 hypothetical protein C6P43_004483 [Kluyveromyces marxianus]KAG0685070.1 hypothetical protein C6P41_000972 [Kluyveromyces marxianus]QGN13487.1 sorbose reductase -like protein SOU2 [Kluyveromyces marxianus]BAO38337.1 sorbose reductase homolog SOU2 [Kluyveromyces marxianus DMKU3-1042]BAP69897.1 sorbose reductase homolog SOU2 [Kluyveromyces marxianus]
MTVKSFIKSSQEDNSIPQDPPVQNYPPGVNYLSLFSQKGKLTVITGGAGAIGGALCEGFASCGSDVVILDTKFQPELSQHLEKTYGIQSKSFQVDITNIEDVMLVFEKILEEFPGRELNTFIANAGIAWTNGSILNEGSTPEMWHRVMNVNVQGTYHCCRYAAEIFKRQGHGNLILTASMSSYINNVPNYQTCYNASKAAVRQMAKGFAVEFASLTTPAGKIRCNSVSPGYTDTVLSSFVPTEQRARWWGLTPMGREALPQELVGAYLYLASDAATYTNGCDIQVDGGYTCV